MHALQDFYKEREVQYKHSPDMFMHPSHLFEFESDQCPINPAPNPD